MRLDPLETTVPRTGSWRLNFLRLDYDTRESVNNPIFVRAVARKFFWDGDTGYLAGQLPRLRQATQFMLTHMRGAELNLPDHAWFTGHDGVGWAGINQPRVGHGLPNNWFDIVTTGPRDLLAAIRFYTALSAMAEIEAWIEVNPEFDSPKPAVLGPDGSSTVPYAESAASLRARLPSVRAAIRAEFWDPLSGRYATWRGADGVLRDYGAVHANLEALAAGIPDAAEARSILDWLDGTRTVAGDTSTGADLYASRFAARANARRNAFDWIWGWSGWTVPFEGQVEDGGASLHTTFFDVQGRLRYGDVAGAWTVWSRMLDHHRTVREFGGRGANFYRDYYAAHPELGRAAGVRRPGRDRSRLRVRREHARPRGLAGRVAGDRVERAGGAADRAVAAAVARRDGGAERRLPRRTGSTCATAPARSTCAGRRSAPSRRRRWSWSSVATGRPRRSCFGTESPHPANSRAHRTG